MKRRSFLGLSLLATAAVARGDDAAPAQRESRAVDPTRLVVMGCDVSALTSSYVDFLQRSGVDVWCYNAPETVRDFADTLNFLDQNSAKIVLVRSVDQILAAKAAAKIAFVIGWQNSRAIEEAGGSDWRYSRPPKTTLRAYYEMGLRVANLCYNLANTFGGGNLDPTSPLTRAGAYLVSEMQEMGILVDCGGHTGEQTSLDIIRIARRPVVCTHSNVGVLNFNPRNSSDRVIEGIARTGGVFGVTAIDAFLNWGVKDAAKDPRRDRRPTVKVGRLVDDIDYIVRLVGPDHVGLGPDFLEGYNTPGQPSFSVDPDKQFQFPREMTYAQDKVQYVDGFENVGQLGNIRRELERRGYTAENIAKILGGNWMRVYAAAWNG